MDGSFFSGDDGRGLIAMSGIMTEWIGGMGKVITDAGECVCMHRFMLTLLGRKEPINVGDRVHFWARKKVHVSYDVEELGEVVSLAPNDAEIKRLRELHHALEKHRHGDAGQYLPTEEGIGTVETFDVEKGHGCIRRDDGAAVVLSVACLRAGGYRTAAIGSRVHFEAIVRAKGLMAFRILSLDAPPILRC